MPLSSFWNPKEAAVSRPLTAVVRLSPYLAANIEAADFPRLVIEDPEFVAMRRFGYSATRLMERYDDGCPEHIIAQALLLSELEVQVAYQALILKLRALMSIEV